MDPALLTTLNQNKSARQGKHALNVETSEDGLGACEREDQIGYI